MSYGLIEPKPSTEAVILTKVDLSSIRVADFTQSSNDERIAGDLDALKVKREMVAIWLVDYQQKLAQGYNRKVRPRGLVARDLVLRKVVGNMKDQNADKLALNWVGPYRVTATAEVRAYYLEDLEERRLL